MNNKLDKFVSKAKLKHGNRYDYSLVEYKHSRVKVDIICLEHGVFEQEPSAHVRGYGCPKCGGTGKLNTDEFIKNAVGVHGDRYDYSLVEYKTNNKKVKIICPEHGVRLQRPASHMLGYGCDLCGGTGKLNNDGFIKNAVGVHGDKYDYSLVIYNGSTSKLKIICDIHGVFEQSPNSHTNGSGCPDCGISTTSDKNKLTLNEFILKSNKTHRNIYDYSLVKYINSKTDIKILCKKHGEFEQRPNHHLRGVGCPICNTSKGELEIRGILEKHNIEFISQYRFNDCKDKNPLPFDFLLTKNNICIEFDGIQHFKPIPWFGGEKAFKTLKRRDKIKTDYCNNNGIKLLRIAYNENIIESILFYLSIPV